MTKEQQKIYAQTAQRLARGGVLNPTAQIIALAEEIEHYRNKIRGLEESLDEETKRRRSAEGALDALRKNSTPDWFRARLGLAPINKPAGSIDRYTRYDPDLGRFVVPLFFKVSGDAISFYIKQGETYTSRSATGMVYSGKDPDIVYGEVIDRLAELENKEETSG